MVEPLRTAARDYPRVAISTTLENKFRVSECGLGKAVEWVHATCNNVSREVCPIYKRVCYQVWP